MRTIRLLATSLLVALSMGVSSCSEELDNQPMVSYPEGGEPLDIVCKEYGISDYKDIELLDYYKNPLVEQANFIGLKNNQLWISSFNSEDKSKIIEWTDNKEFDRIRRVYKGYGEYEEFTIQGISLFQIIPIDNNFATSLTYSNNGKVISALLFKKDSETKEILTRRTEIHIGYNNSIINDNCCYSLSGDTICVAEKGFGYSNIGTIYTSDFIYYNEAIYNVTKDIRRVIAGTQKESNLSALEKSYYSACIKYLSGEDVTAEDWAAYKSRISAVGVLVDGNYKPLQRQYLEESDGEVPNILASLEKNAFIQLIMGEQPMDYFDTFVQEWYAQGGQELTEKIREENS